MKNLYRMMNEVKFLKIRTMTKTLLMNSLQLPIEMILTIIVILHILIQVPSFLNLGYYYGYININQDFAYHMVFPMPDLKSQVFAMYQRPGFEQNLTKWAHRH